MMIPTIARCCLVAFLVTSSSFLFAQTDKSVQSWGDPVDGVQISLNLDPQKTGGASHVPLRIDLRNVGSSSVKVVLDVYCGPASETTNIDLILADDQGKSQRLQNNGGPGRPGGCAGQIHFWEVPPPPGASFSTPINLDYYTYLSKVTHRSETGWQPGGAYSLQVELYPVRLYPSPPYHTTKSNVLRVQFPAK